MANRPKALVTWKQPRRFREQMRQVEKRVTNWWVMPVLALALTGFFMLQWFVATLKEGPRRPPPFEAVLPVVLSVSFLLVYGTVWLIWMLPSSITVTEQGFRREKWAMTFDEIAVFGWYPATEFSTLLLVGKDGRRVLFGVPKDETETKLRAIFRERNVTEDPTLKPFSGEKFHPTAERGLAIVAPVLIIVLYFGLLIAHTALISHLNRETRRAREQAGRDWQAVRNGLIQDGLAPEKLPENPIERYRSSPSSLTVQRYLILAPLVCLTAILFLGIALLKSRIQVKNLQKLAAEKTKSTGADAQMSPSSPATD